MNRTGILVSALLLLGSVIEAQCTGNGGNASLVQGVPVLGAVDTTTITGGAGQAFCLFLSDGIAPVTFPGLGTVCIDLSSPALWLFASGSLPPSGAVSFTTLIPSTPFWQSIVLFAQGAVTDPSHPAGLAITGAIRKDYELGDTWSPVGPMLAGAGLSAIATISDRNLVFLSGGVNGPQQTTGATSVYVPLSRTFVPGPPMSGGRANHTATTLSDGRVLVSGGTGGFTGTATANCEIFDPATWSMQPAAPMGTPRTRHRALRLVDGRVLVTGGATLDFIGAQGIGSDPLAAYNSTLSSAEIYDPVLDAWTPAGNTMANGRTGHAATRLQDGRVLVAGGYDGSLPFVFSPVPKAIATCDLFDPATGLFSPGPSLPSTRAECGATLLANSHVLVCGGSTNAPVTNVPNAIAETVLFTGTAWLLGPALPQPMTGVHQFPVAGGRVWVGQHGGPPALVDLAAGTAAWAASMPGQVSFSMMAQTAEGTILRCGGLQFVLTSNVAALYTPTP